MLGVIPICATLKENVYVGELLLPTGERFTLLMKLRELAPPLAN